MRSEVAEARRIQLRLADLIEPAIQSGTTVAQMRAMAARERMDLGLEFLRIGNLLYRSGSRKKDAFAYRSAIGRFYYAMFQSARAVVFVDFGGDDNNGHQDLPKHLPHTLPNRAQMINDLKDARIRRNDADYSPYPTAVADWQPIARDLRSTASSFVSTADTYLKTRGI